MGTKAFQEILSAAEHSSKISSVSLHVQVSNVDAKRFYERHGFTVVREVEGYYKKLEPRNAWLLEVCLSLFCVGGSSLTVTRHS